MYKRVSDSHCHSNCSFDGKDSVDNMCKRAAEIGLYAITITDHCEANGYREPLNSEFGDFSKLIPRSIEQMKAAQEKYKKEIHLFRGIELGQPLQDVESTKAALSLDDFDFVLASVHNVKDEQDFYWLNYTEEFAHEILQRYFDELLQTARWNKFDSLAHITYPLRYILGEQNININLQKSFSEQIDEILKTVIYNQKAIEVNTSGLRQKLGETLPNKEIIKRYQSLGGKYITVGSDAHNCADLGKGLKEALQLVQSCGFSKYTIYSKHEPMEIEI